MEKRTLQNIVAGIMVGTASGCTGICETFKSPFAPRYTTNVEDAKASSFNSQMFNSEVPTSDFGRSGKRVIGKINPSDKVTDLDGNELDTSTLLPIWTLQIQSPNEIGYDIDKNSRNLEIRRPDRAVRVYQSIGQGTLLTSKTYSERHIPRNRRDFAISHPHFWVPSHSISINNQKMELFYATTAVNGSESLAIIPNAQDFFLYDGRISINGEIYTETLARVESMGDGISRDSIITAELKLVDPTSQTNTPLN